MICLEGFVKEFVRLLTQTHEYQSRLLESIDGLYKYEFVQTKGEEHFDLMKVVFMEYIGIPFLDVLSKGHSVIKIGEPPLLDNIVNSWCDFKPEENRVVFFLQSTLLTNDIVTKEERDAEKDDLKLYLKLMDGRYLSLVNVTAQNLGAALAIKLYAEWLDGMPPKVNIADYYPVCGNCMNCKDNLERYRQVFEREIVKFIEDKTGCVLDRKEYKKDGTGFCRFFQRATLPDIGRTIAIYKDFIAEG